MKHKFFIIVFTSVLILSAVVTYITATQKSGSVAQIYSGGTLLYEIDLKDIASPYELPIDNADGQNIILIKDGKISVKDANCPDKLCVKQGSISNSSYPIICLPNELVIKIADSQSGDLPDVISR